MLRQRVWTAWAGVTQTCKPGFGEITRTVRREKENPGNTRERAQRVLWRFPSSKLA